MEMSNFPSESLENCTAASITRYKSDGTVSCLKMCGAIEFAQGAFGFVIAELVINANDLLKSSAR